MSLNTYILIKELRHRYYITLRNADDSTEIEVYGIERNLRKAIKIAQEYIDECEYGIHFILEDK